MLVSRNVVSVSEISALNLIVCLYNELYYLLSLNSPEGKYVVYIAFPNERLNALWFKIYVSTLAIKILAKYHGCTMGL